MQILATARTSFQIPATDEMVLETLATGGILADPGNCWGIISNTSNGGNGKHWQPVGQLVADTGNQLRTTVDTAMQWTSTADTSNGWTVLQIVATRGAVL